MDVKRLEELAIRANTMHADGLSDEDYADLHDLARCAAAWAKVERKADRTWLITEDVHGFSLETCWDGSGYPTAIEAVEAAEVGK